MIDPKSLDRSGGGPAPILPVSESTLWREWLDSVRGRVGTALAVRWFDVRSATQVDLRVLYDAGMSAADAAAMVVRRWNEIEQSKRAEAGGAP